MPVFTFRLQPLLEQKLELEKQAQVGVVNRQRALDQALRLLSELRDRQKALQTKLHDVSTRILEPTNAAIDVQRRDNYREGLAADETEARQAAVAQEFAVEEAERELRRARIHLAQCSREVEKLEKYRDKQQSRFNAALEQKEQHEQDELGTVMHLSRRSER